jgi:hypothetical protein
VLPTAETDGATENLMDVDPSNSFYMDIQPEDGDSDSDSEVNIQPRTRIEMLKV